MDSIKIVVPTDVTELSDGCYSSTQWEDGGMFIGDLLVVDWLHFGCNKSLKNILDRTSYKQKANLFHDTDIVK